MADTTMDARIQALQRQVHAISLAIQQAVARGDTDGIARLRTLYAKVRADVRALQDEAVKAEMPSAFMIQLAGISDELVNTGKVLVKASVAAVQGVGATLRYLPLILLVGLIVVGLIYAGKIRKGL